MDTKKVMHGDLGPQYLAAGIANFLSFVYGMSIGWTAPAQALLQANYTGTNETSPLGQDAPPLTDEEFSWIGGIFCIGGVLGTSFLGYCAETFGRRKTLILLGVPFIIAFSLMALATNPIYLFVARLIGGIAGAGTCIIVPMYIGETVEDHIRGLLGALFNLFICFGILAAFVIGSYTSYMVLTLSCLISAGAFILTALWLPETPTYLLIKERRNEAYNSLLKLRGNRIDVVEYQLAQMQSSLKEMASSDTKTMSLKEMIADLPTRKALIIALTVMTIQQASGISPIMNYTVVIFNASGSQLSSAIATIMVAIIQVIGGIIASVLMDKAGRRMLLLISSIGMSLTLGPIAYFFHLKLTGADPEFLQSIGWVPVTCLSVYILAFALGFGPVPFVLLAEIFRNEARSLATSISVFQVWGVSFFFLKFFSNISNAVGIDICFALFAVSCAGGALFIAFYITETKGKSLDTILAELGGETILGDYKSVPLTDLSSAKTVDIDCYDTQ